MTTSQRLCLWISILLLLLVTAFNGALAMRHLRSIRAAEVRRQSSNLLTGQIRQMLVDALDIEAGQRGYLLTGADSYLEPYRAARDRVPVDIAALRASLANGRYQERGSRLEALFTSKISEADQTIALRQKGYRHRAFMQVNNNEGQKLMTQIRADLATVGSLDDGNLSERDVQASVDKATVFSVRSNAVCLFITGLILAVMYFLNRHLSLQISSRQKMIESIHNRWSGLREVLSHETLDLLGEISTTANQLFQKYGDFLPQGGQAQTERLRMIAQQADRSIRQALSLDV